MPRSTAAAFGAEQRPEERTSLSRGSIGKGSLTGRYSLAGGSVGGGPGYNDAISIGSAATRHWVNSVSDIYGPDEIEELLEDLNRLELAAGASFTDEDESVVVDLGYHNHADSTADGIQLSHHDAAADVATTAVPRARLKRVNAGGGGGAAPVQNDPKAAVAAAAAAAVGSGDCDNDVVVHNVGESGGGGGGMLHHPAAGLGGGGGRMVSSGSPTFSVRSWDSHTHYQEFKEIAGAEEDPDSFFPSRPMQNPMWLWDTYLLYRVYFFYKGAGAWYHFKTAIFCILVVE